MVETTDAYRAYFLFASQEPGTSFVQRVLDKCEVWSMNREIANYEKAMIDVRAKLEELGSAPPVSRSASKNHLVEIFVIQSFFYDNISYSTVEVPRSRASEMRNPITLR